MSGSCRSAFTSPRTFRGGPRKGKRILPRLGGPASVHVFPNLPNKRQSSMAKHLHLHATCIHAQQSSSSRWRCVRQHSYAPCQWSVTLILMRRDLLGFSCLFPVDGVVDPCSVDTLCTDNPKLKFFVTCHIVAHAIFELA